MHSSVASGEGENLVYRMVGGDQAVVLDLIDRPVVRVRELHHTVVAAAMEPREDSHVKTTTKTGDSSPSGSSACHSQGCLSPVAATNRFETTQLAQAQAPARVPGQAARAGGENRAGLLRHATCAVMWRWYGLAAVAGSSRPRPLERLESSGQILIYKTQWRKAHERLV